MGGLPEVFAGIRGAVCLGRLVWVFSDTGGPRYGWVPVVPMAFRHALVCLVQLVSGGAWVPVITLAIGYALACTVQIVLAPLGYLWYQWPSGMLWFA